MKDLNSKNKITAAVIGASVNLILFFVKLYIGLSTNSVAIYADALNSMADSAVCIIAVIGFCLISEKPSEKYPFGFGKAEELLDLIVSVVILVTGGVFAFVSLERLFYPVPVWYSELYAVIVAATAAVKLALALYFRSAAKKSQAGIIKGLGTDSLLDFFITLCTLVSFTLSAKADFSVDGFAGIIISILLLIEGIKMTVSAVKTLIGKNNSDECEKIKAAVESDSAVEAVHGVSCITFGEARVYTAEIGINCSSAKEVSDLVERLESAVERENIKLYLKIRR